MKKSTYMFLTVLYIVLMLVAAFPAHARDYIVQSRPDIATIYGAPVVVTTLTVRIEPYYDPAFQKKALKILEAHTAAPPFKMNKEKLMQTCLSVGYKLHECQAKLAE